MSKFIDLEEQIVDDSHAHRQSIFSNDARVVLRWLDDHADRAPGRTVTASEFDEAVESCITEDATVPPHKFAERLGIVCVPDPKPPESAPGRTITESRLAEVLADENWTFTPTHYFRVFSRLGITVVPDSEPEPTEAEKLAKIRADAWDEGYETGCSSPYGTATPSGKPYDPEPNPHRE